MIRAIGWPIISRASYWNSRTAPSFQLVMFPSTSHAMIASDDDSTIAASCSRSSTSRFCSVTSAMTAMTPSRFPFVSNNAAVERRRSTGTLRRVRPMELQAPERLAR
jgi:hypothetical protein